MSTVSKVCNQEGQGSEDGVSDWSYREPWGWRELDEQLQELGGRFSVRIQVEAALRQRCEEMMEKLSQEVQARKRGPGVVRRAGVKALRALKILIGWQSRSHGDREGTK